jgi:hypothetical protein
MIAQVTGLEPGEFVHTLGDAHLYLNHLEQADLQLSREPRPLPCRAFLPDLGTWALRGGRLVSRLRHERMAGDLPSGTPRR